MNASARRRSNARNLNVRRALLPTALLTLVALLTLGAPAAQADANEAQLLVVLDASSSMLEPASDGGTRADAAKNALLGVVDTLGADERVGLRQFGATVAGLADPASCTDSQLAVPIGTDNRQALKDAANSYIPYGETPIGFALQEAGKDLGAQGQRTILLISDGESNCQPDPCAVAAELAAQGIDLTIHVVGFDVSGAARDALVCIANAGGGQYFDVSDTSGLSNVFAKVSTRAFRDFALDGQEVIGTVDAASAPTLTPGTRYITYLPAPKATLNYLVTRTIPESTLWVSINATAHIRAQDLSADLYADATAQEYCGSDLSFPSTWGGTWSLTTMSLGSGSDPDCTRSDVSLLTIENWLGSQNADGAPAEILIIEEPPVPSTDGLPPVPPEVGAWVEPPASAPQPILGGTTLSDTPALTSGSYSFDLLPGETTLFHVPLDWGQSLQARSTSDAGSSLTLFSPNRKATTASLIEVVGLDPDPASAPRISGIRTKPVTYLGREGSSGSEVAMALAGDYTIAVTRQACTDCGQNPGPIPVTLDVLVDGEVSGVPEYVVPTVTPTLSPSATPSASTDSPSPSTDSPTPSALPINTGKDRGIPVALPIAVGAVGLALLGAGTWALLRRRQKSAQSPIPGSWPQG